MPKIIVVSEPKQGGSTRTLEEHVVSEHLEDSHSAAQLVERVGWAIVDAEAAEASPEPVSLPDPVPTLVWAEHQGRVLAA